MKQKIRKIIPNFVASTLRKVISCVSIFYYYFRDSLYFVLYSSLFCQFDNQNKMIGRISMAYHVIEKGITMPDRKLGFGRDVVLQTINLCEVYVKKGYDVTDNQFLHALGVLDEYLRIHESNNFELNKKVVHKIRSVLNRGITFEKTEQICTTKQEYFRDVNASFDKFSMSRYSLRNLEKGVDIELIKKALQIAQNAPSSCNRQASRVYVVEKEKIVGKILNVQQGSRGFGHLSDKLLVVTVDIGVYASPRERNAGYVDGGMYGMNLLYALHCLKIGACTLNCYFSPKSEKMIRKICDIPNSEMFIMMILIGNVPDNFSVALSKRQEVVKVTKFI